MQHEITTHLKAGEAVIAEDAIVEIHADFSEYVNASGDVDFTLDDWDVMSVSWEGMNGVDACVEYPVRRMAHTEQQEQLDNEHRRKVREMLESLRIFIPLTDAEIEASLIAEYERRA
ncbi:MAG: hypothetical protein GY807_20930 [Gammaproteobacteria bacterium]|nr:hypothetical protein [Gammaproteobacteria bacterium]